MTVRLRAAALLLGAVALACGRPDSGSGATGSDGTGDPPVGERGSGLRADTVLVELDEYSIEMPDVVPQGAWVFRLHNAGFEEHDFVLSGDSVLTELERPLNPRETRTLDVTLEPGEYRVACTVSGHDSRGMVLRFEVLEDDEGRGRSGRSGRPRPDRWGGG